MKITSTLYAIPKFHVFFWGLILVFSTWLFFSGFESGYHSDELDMIAYGKANINWYTSGGVDTSYRSVSLEDGTRLPVTMKYYGSGFEYLSNFFSNITGVSSSYEINLRHFLNQLLAVIAVIFSGLIARKIFRNDLSAIITIVFLFFTPFFTGLAIFDIKDIPFVTGYMACSYWMLIFIEPSSKPKVSTMLLLGLAIGFSLSVRLALVIPLLLFVIFLLFKFYNEKRENPVSKSVRTPLLALGAMFMGGGLMLVSWPFLIENPISNFFAALNIAKAFPQRIPFNFEGVAVDSLSLPPGYVWKSMAITLPIVIIGTFLLAIISLAMRFRKVSREIWFVLVISFLPLLYVHISGTSLYNNWRHVLFVFPGLVVVAAGELSIIIITTRQLLFRLLMGGLIVVGLLSPAVWMFRSGQYSYMYYNELAGGWDEAYYNYETDFWQIGVKEALDNIDKSKIINSGDTLLIVTNAFSVTNYYFSKKYPLLKNIRIQRTSAKSFNTLPWDYAIISNLFFTPEELETIFPPDFKKEYIVTVGNKAIVATLHEHERNLRRQIFSKMSEGQFIQSDSLLKVYFEKMGEDINNLQKDYAGLEGVIAFNKGAVGNGKQAVDIAKRRLRRSPNDYFSNLVVGMAYYDSKDYANAKRHLLVAAAVNSRDVMAKRLLKNFR